MQKQPVHAASAPYSTRGIGARQRLGRRHRAFRRRRAGRHRVDQHHLRRTTCPRRGRSGRRSNRRRTARTFIAVARQSGRSRRDPDRIRSRQMNELDLVRWGMARIANLHWSMGDAAAADEVLHVCCNFRSATPRCGWSSRGLPRRHAPSRTCSTRPPRRRSGVLNDASASPPAVEWAVFGGTLAAALTGRVDDAAVDRRTQPPDREQGRRPVALSRPRTARFAR